MKFSTLLSALLTFTVVLASPGKSPICDITKAKDAFAASPMAPNAQNLATDKVYAITSDSATYTPGQTIVFSMTGSMAFNGALFYVSPTADPSKRVGQFTVPTNMQTNADVCTGSEFPESSLTHTAGQTYDAVQNIVFKAPAADQGELTLNAIIVVKMGTGYAWGIYPDVVKIGSGTPSLDTAPVYGATPMPNEVDSSVECPAAYTATLIRKCKVKEEYKTTIHSTVTQVMTETKIETTTEVSVTTEFKTETVTVTPTCPDVLGENEAPTPTPMYGEVIGEEETTTTMMHETTTTMMHDVMPAETPMMHEHKDGYY